MNTSHLGAPRRRPRGGRHRGDPGRSARHGRCESHTHRATPTLTTVQLLSFNDYHGHLEATDAPAEQDARTRAQTPVGGAEYLASTLVEPARRRPATPTA